MRALYEYGDDGANVQARAVLSYLSRGHIEVSWDESKKEYLARPTVGRWENCREQGYVISLRSKDFRRQYNIAFFEHRNSDEICAIGWEQCTINCPTIETADFGEKYENSYDVDFSVKYGEVLKMVDWIENELHEWWIKAN